MPNYYADDLEPSGWEVDALAEQMDATCEDCMGITDPEMLERLNAERPRAVWLTACDCEPCECGGRGCADCRNEDNPKEDR